jgi:hypothetical protein
VKTSPNILKFKIPRFQHEIPDRHTAGLRVVGSLDGETVEGGRETKSKINYEH